MTPEQWFQLINLFGWPSVFIFGLYKKWWSMGPPGIDPEWKVIALKSINTNEELVQEAISIRKQSVSGEGGS